MFIVKGFFPGAVLLESRLCIPVFALRRSVGTALTTLSFIQGHRNMATPQFKNADNILSVTLQKNQFSPDENSFIGRVTRNTVTLENLIASISEKNEGVSPYMVQHVANLLRDEMLTACQNAKAVDVLGLGTLFISVAGSVSGENPGGSSTPGFKLNFTPSSRA